MPHYIDPPLYAEFVQENGVWKIASMPSGSNWKAFASVCMLCGIGFTVSMFIADLSYAGLGAEGAALLSQAKLGVLCGSVISAVMGCILLNKTLPQE